jgi:hypothetical protein
MKEKFIELFDEKIGQLTFLDREKVLNLMEITYNLGKEHNQQKYGQLKNTFEELLDEFELFGSYTIPIEKLQEYWKTKAVLL